MPDGGGKFVSMTQWGALDVSVREGRVVSVSPFEGDPDPSPILNAVPESLYHESRIARPAVRRGFLEKTTEGTARGAEPFVEISWDEALDLVANELARVKAEWGNEAIFASSGWASAGVFHEARPQLGRFLKGFGGFVDQVTNYSFGAASVIVPHVVGTMLPVNQPTAWPVIARHTELMVMFGGAAPKNGQVNKSGVGAHDTSSWLRTARRNGARFVNISPRRDDAADFLDPEWLPVLPNTDMALMLGLAHTLLGEGLADLDFLARYTTGFERFRAYLEAEDAPRNADWAASVTGIDAETIRGLARRMAASRTMIAVSWSVQRGDHGEQPYWMAIALAAMLGQIGLPGGGFGFGYGSQAGIGLHRPQLPLPGLPTGANPVKTYIPVARFADMLLEPGGEIEFNGDRIAYPDIRLVYWCGGNPFHKHQDINRLLEAWSKPETVIVHEPWWTPAARRADIVLPVTTTLERNDIGASHYDRYFFAMHKAIEPVGDARNEYDIYAALAGRLGFREEFTEGRTETEWLRHMYDVARQKASRKRIEMPGFDEFWETGHIAFDPPGEPEPLFADFRADPQKHPLRTPSGRIEIFSEKIDGFGYDDCPGHPTWMPPYEWLGSDAAEAWPLHLVSNAPSHRLHGQLDFGSHSRSQKIAGREPVWINSVDAEPRGISEGDVVRVFNDRGQCLAGAHVTDAIRPGVVQLSTGAWFDPLDPACPGALEKHGNPNVLTRDRGTSRLAQACTAQSALVEVERYSEEAPEITAFDQPETFVRAARG